MINLDPTVIGTVAAAYISKDGVGKILGPTADYLGAELRNFTEKRIQNVGLIFNVASKKLGDKENESGSVHPKVLKAIISEGSYSNEELALEYFGGVLACSKTELGRDDRGARFAKLIDSLTTYQLRAHYIVFRIIANSKLTQEKLGTPESRKLCQVFIPASEFYDAMEFTKEEWEETSILSHIFDGLAADGIITGKWGAGSKDYISQLSYEPSFQAESDGIICDPTIMGVELFLWAFGKGNQTLNFIFNDDFVFELPTPILATPSAKLTRKK